MKETSYLLQAALISVWWVGLSFSQTFFRAFQFNGIPPVAFWCFFTPDIVVIAALSVIRAYRKIAALELIILGAFAYAALYCVSATVLTAEISTATGLLPTGLMLLGLAYNVFLCFNQSLFRTSNSKSVTLNAIKTLIQIVCIWILALVVIPYVLLEAFEGYATPIFGPMVLLGVVAFLSFSGLGLSSSFFMVRDGNGTPLPLDQTNLLVVSGPYRFVRNPMAIAGIGQGLAIAVAFQSISILIYSLLGAIVWHLVVRPIEERDMVRRFGEPYLQYREEIKCWLPKFTSGGKP